MSDYPEVWNFEEQGKATMSGKLVSINAVQAKKYGTDEMVEKFVANIEVEGETYAVWLDSAVLLRCFRDEARNRQAIGKKFAPEEQITIEYLGKRQGATYKYKDFKVTFEYAAPSQDGFDALAGTASPQTDALADNAEDSSPAPAPAEQPKAPEVAETPSDDDIPF